MNTDNFLNKLEEFWGDFNCNKNINDNYGYNPDYEL